MYYGKKKAIIITVIIVLLVLILAAGGVCAYFFTDLFKSNETLFLKYMVAGLQNMQVPASTQLQDITSMQQNNPYGYAQEDPGRGETAGCNSSGYKRTGDSYRCPERRKESDITGGG